MIRYLFIICDDSEPMMETLNFYQRRMSCAVPDPVFLICSPKEAFIESIRSLDDEINENTTVIMFNNRGFTASLDGKTLYWAKKNVRLINILVDHPFYYTDMLLMAPPNMRLGLVDRHFVTMLDDWLPAIGKNAFFFPHGGTDYGISKTPFENRQIEVLYTGSRYPADVMNPPLGFLPKNGSDFYEYAENKYFEDEYIEEDGIAENYLKMTGHEASVSQKIMMTVCILKSVKFRVMHEMKTRLITALASEGINITIHGNGWEELRDSYPGQITLAGWLDSEGCIQEMGNSKITLNMMPFFRDGAHERVFNAVLSGSALLSNRSRYLEEIFEEGNEIIFTGNNPSETAGIIKSLLSSPEKWHEMTQKAYEKAGQCTWEDRMKEYLA